MGRRMPRLSCLLLTITVLVPRPALAQSGVVAPTDNLVTDGLPPVPAAIAEAARPYSEFRAAGLWDWHPTRRVVAPGRPLRLHVHAPHRARPGPVGGRPEQPHHRSHGAGTARRGVRAARLVTRRPDHSPRSGRVGKRELSVAGGRRERPEDPAGAAAEQ